MFLPALLTMSAQAAGQALPSTPPGVALMAGGLGFEFSFHEIGMLAAEVIGHPDRLKIRMIPIWSLRLAAALATADGLVSRASRRFAAILRWMIWSGTHDAVAPACGTRRLRAAFCAKRANMVPPGDLTN